jgi:two-component system sensor histidine kinase YesM
MPTLSFNNGIFRKLLISYILLILIPVSLIGIFFFKVSEQIISDQVSKSNRHTLTQIAKNIESLIDEIIAEFNIYNQNFKLETDLVKRHSNSYSHLKNIQSVESQMLRYSLTADGLQQETILVGANGTVYTNPYGPVSITAANIGQNDWYRKMLQNQEQITWLNTRPSFFLNHRDETVFTAIKALMNNFSNDLYGVLILSVKTSSLYNIYRDSLEKGNQIFIIDAAGTIISHSNLPRVESKMKAEQLLQLVRNDTGDSRILSFDKVKYLCSYQKINKIDWYIINTIPLAVLSQKINLLEVKFFLVFLLCATFSIIAAIIISRHISFPLISLCNRIRSAYSNENFSKETLPQDEVSLLATEYDHLILKLEQTINDLVKTHEGKRTAELQALQMQINPHFLYNTLNSVKCLVWTGKTKLIIPTVNALIHLLEQTVNVGPDLITIEQELDNIKNYIYIQEIRTCNLISAQYRIDNELIHYRIPKLLLQPIIENAIFHGLEPKNAKGNLTIFISAIEDQIQIEIIDDGVGMNETAMTASSKKNHNRFSGIGIPNVAERLQLYFGPAYGIKIQSEVGIGTSVILNLPKII